MNCAAPPSRGCRNCWRRCRRSISSWSKASSREPHRKIEVHRAANGKPLLFPDDPAIVGIATDAAVETALPVAHLDDIAAIAAMMRRSAIADRRRAGATRARNLRRKMAQLSDDCFAFGGPMMSVDEAVGIIAARVKRGAGHRDRRARRGRRARSRPRHCGAAAAAAVHQFRRRRLCGAQRAIFRKARSRRLPVTGRVQAGASAQAPIKPGHAMRIFTGAPMPEGADTVFMQEDVRLDEDGQGGAARGSEARRQCAPGGRRHSAGHCRAGGGPAPAAAGRRARRRVRPDAARGASGASASRCFRPATNWCRRATPRAAAQLFDSNRFMLMAMLARLGCEVSDLGILARRSRVAGARP